MVAIGVDAGRHLRGRRDHLLLAALPVLLGVHQIVEAFVWWGLEGQVSHDVGRLALWAYLFVAMVVLPVFVPTAVLVLEPTAPRRRRMLPFVGLGVIVSGVLLVSIARGPIGATLHPWHLSYGTGPDDGTVVAALYVAAVCGSLLVSGYRHIVIYGLANLAAVVTLAELTVDGFASLWCVYAAVSAGAIALHMRYAKPHRSAPYVLT